MSSCKRSSRGIRAYCGRMSCTRWLQCHLGSRRHICSSSKACCRRVVVSVVVIVSAGG